MPNKSLRTAYAAFTRSAKSRPERPQGPFFAVPFGARHRVRTAVPGTGFSGTGFSRRVPGTGVHGGCLAPGSGRRGVRQKCEFCSVMAGCRVLSSLQALCLCCGGRPRALPEKGWSDSGVRAVLATPKLVPNRTGVRERDCSRTQCAGTDCSPCQAGSAAASWPHAAAMSRPRVRRIVDGWRAASSTSLNCGDRLAGRAVEHARSGCTGSGSP